MFFCIRQRLKKTVLTGIVALCWGSAASAVEVSPYFNVWSNSRLTEAKRNAGLDSATLAFAVIKKGNCSLDPDFLDMLPNARRYVAAGGRLTLSLGGQLGEYVEIACKNDDQLMAMLEKMMLDSGSRRLDWDIEGTYLSGQADPGSIAREGTARRIRVLARLQSKYPDLHTSFTLPGLLHGLHADSMTLLNTTVASGVRIDRVNIMTMSFGRENIRALVTPPTVGQAAIATFRSAARQLATVYPAKTPSQLHAMMGITPMIGTNDDGTTLSLGDAQTIADFARSNGVGFLSYWSFQRDRTQTVAGNGNLGSFSGVVQSDYQFYNIFKSAGEGAPTTVSPAGACTQRFVQVDNAPAFEADAARCPPVARLPDRDWRGPHQ